MKKLLCFALIIFSYHVFLIILPILIFLASLSLSNQVLIDAFPWLYGPWVFFSPVLTVFLGYRIKKSQANEFSWLTPIIISFLGFLPVLTIFLFFSSLANPRDYLFLISFPILLGTAANLVAYLDRFLKRR